MLHHIETGQGPAVILLHAFPMDSALWAAQRRPLAQAATVRLAQAISIPVIASGGVSTLDDVRALCAVEKEGIMGAIIGRALYDGAIDLVEAQRLADTTESR